MSKCKMDNDLSIKRIEEAIATGAIDGPDDIQVWHLLWCLLAYCADRGVDLQTELTSARSDFEEDKARTANLRSQGKLQPASPETTSLRGQTPVMLAVDGLGLHDVPLPRPGLDRKA
jgi:hypothetical protein